MLSYPELGTSPSDDQYLETIDEQAIERFKAAYTQYAKSLGTNSARPVAISHLIGNTAAVEVFTLHIRLAGVDQSLLVLLILREESLERIDRWLINEFDEDLEREDSDEGACDLIFSQRELRIEEQIPVLVDLDLDLQSVTELAVQSSQAVDRALAIYARLDANRFEGEVGVKRKLTIYAMDAQDRCDECGDALVLLGGVVDEQQQGTGKKGRELIRHQLHRDDFHHFCVVLAWMCRIGQVSEFTSLNHTCQTEEEIMTALSALHSDEFSQIDTLMTSVTGMLEELFSGAGGDDQEGAGAKPTLH